MSFNIRRCLLGLIDAVIYISVFIGTVTVIKLADPNYVLVLSNYIYSAVIFCVFGKMGLKSRWLLTSAAVLLTAFFGLLSALIDVGLFSGYFDNFLYRFSIYYLRGIPFYIAQIVTNAFLFPLLFEPLAEKLGIIKRRFIF